MPTRNIVLTDHRAELIEQLVASGRYQNASEVLREGLRLVESREAKEKARAFKALRDAARVGIADADVGRFRSFASSIEPAGRKGRHFVMLRIGAEQDGGVIEVLRLLHDSMDLPRHLPGIDENE